jgi:uncharacterized protein with GYD domain
MTTYVLLADVDADEFQNPQELAAVWGDLRTDIERLDGELADAYAIIGEYDFLMLVDVPDPESALRVTIAVERHGIRTKAMRGFEIDQLADIVADV